MSACLFFYSALCFASQVATNIGLSWGGKQRKLRDSSVLPGVLGNFDVPAKMYYIPGKGTGQWKKGPKWVDKPCVGSREVDMALKPGQRISNIFGPNDPPPWYDLNAQRFPRARNADEILQETNRRKKARQKYLEKKQLEDPLTVLTPKEEEQFQTSDPRKYPKIPGLFCFTCMYACIHVYVCCRVCWLRKGGQTDVVGKGSLEVRTDVSVR